MMLLQRQKQVRLVRERESVSAGNWETHHNCAILTRNTIADPKTSFWPQKRIQLLTWNQIHKEWMQRHHHTLLHHHVSIHVHLWPWMHCENWMDSHDGSVDDSCIQHTKEDLQKKTWHMNDDKHVHFNYFCMSKLYYYFFHTSY